MRKITVGLPPVPAPQRRINCHVIASVPSVVVTTQEATADVPSSVSWIDERGWDTLVAIIGDNWQYENGWIHARPIDAIKLVRDVLRLSGDVGLKECKAIIDSVRTGTWKPALEDAVIEIY